MPLSSEAQQVLRDFFEDDLAAVDWLIDNNIADPKALKAHLLKMAAGNRAEAAKSADTEENEWLLEEAAKYERAAKTL